MLYKVFDFADKEVADVMVPRPEVVALSVDLPPEEALAGRARLAVHAVPGLPRVARRRSSACCTSATCSTRCTSAASPRCRSRRSSGRAYIVPETKDLAALLTEFRRRTSTWRSCVDEYGDMEGIVTLEDVLEEIVGEIEDEFDLPDESIERIDDAHDPHRRHVPDRRLQRAVPHRACRMRTTTRSAASSSACSAARRGRRRGLARRPALPRARGRGLADPQDRGDVRAAARPEGSRRHRARRARGRALRPGQLEAERLDVVERELAAALTQLLGVLGAELP